MPTAADHPSTALLEAFALGKLPDAADPGVEDHLGGCSTCQDLVAAATDDTLTGLLAAARPRLDAEAGDHTTDHPVASPGTGTLTWGGPPPATLVAAPAGVPAGLADHPRYRLIRELGSGGMGAVWLAQHTVMGRPVAVKVIRPDLLARPGAAERFLREVRAAARLSHPHIVAAFDAERAGDSHFLVMEFVPGESLADLLERAGPLPIADACRAARDTARGLHHAHTAGLTHRDVKPHNLMRTHDGAVKVLDFGLAGVVDFGAGGGGGGDNPSLTGAGAVMGTPNYIAPEQATDARTAGPPADIYSLGCTLYHLLAGRPPFPDGGVKDKLEAHVGREPAPLRGVRPDVPAALAAVVARAMMKKPADRFPTAAAMADALAPFTAGPPETVGWTAAATDPTVVFVPRPPRRRWPVAVAAGLLAAGLLAAGGVVYRIQTAEGEVTITPHSPDAEVMLLKGGTEVRVIDTKTGRTVTVPVGEYEVRLKRKADGLTLTTDKVVVRRGEVELVTIERVAKAPAPPAPPADAAGPAAAGPAFRPPTELARFAGGDDFVLGVAFSPDGTRIATAGGRADLAVHLWDAATGKEVRRFTGHTGQVYAVALSPDGKTAASGGDDDFVRVWDVDTGKEVRRLSVPGWTVGIAVSPDGTRVAVGGHRGTLHVWDAATGEEVAKFDGHADLVQAVAFSPDGSRILTGGGPWDGPGDTSVRLWDAATGKELRRLAGHTRRVRGVAFLPGGRAASSGADGTLRVWDLDTGAEVFNLPTTPRGSLDVKASPDGRRLYTADLDGVVRAFDAAAGRELGRFVPLGGAGVYTLALSPDGSRLAAAGKDRTARVWRVADPLPVPAPVPRVLAEERRFVGHTSVVGGVALSPDGRFALTSGDDPPAVRLWDATTGRLVRRFLGHAGPIHDLTFTPDGKRFLSCSRDGTVRLWDVGTGQEVRRFAGHKGEVWAAALSPDGRYALTGCHDNLVRLFDAATGKEVRRFEGHGGHVDSVAWSPDGRRAATAGGLDRTVRIWDVDAGTELRRLDAPWEVRSVAFAPDGRRVAAGSCGGPEIVVWDADTGKEVGRPVGHTTGPVYTLAFTPDGRLLSGANDGTVRLWDADAGRELSRFTDGGEVYNLCVSRDGRHALTNGAFSKEPKLLRLPDVPPRPDRLAGGGGWNARLAYTPDGRGLLAGGTGTVLFDPAAGRAVRTLAADTGAWGVALSADGRLAAAALGKPKSVVVWDAATGKERHRFGPLVTFNLWDLAFTPDGRHLFFTTDVRVYKGDIATGEQVLVFDDKSGEDRSLAVSPDGKRVAGSYHVPLPGGKSDARIRVWDAATGKVERHWGGFVGDIVNQLAWTPDGAGLVSAHGLGSVRVWDANTGAERLTFPAHAEMVEGLAVSPDGGRLLTAGRDGQVYLWDLATGKRLAAFADAHPGGALGVAFAPDGRAAASGGKDGVVRLWELPPPPAANPGAAAPPRRPAAPTRLEAGDENVIVVAFSPDGRRVASAGDADVIRLNDAATGKLVRRLTGHTNWVYDVAFAPDGRTLVSGGNDNTVRVWDAATGGERHTLKEHTAAVNGVAVSPDGKFALSAGDDRRVLLWDLAAGRLVRTLAGHTARVVRVAFAPDGGRAVTASDDRTVRVWDLATGEATLSIPTSAYPRAAFAADGKRVVWADDTGAVRVSDAATGRLERRFDGAAGVPWDLGVTPDGRYAFTSSGHNSDNLAVVWDVAAGRPAWRIEGGGERLNAGRLSPDGRRAAAGTFRRGVLVWELPPPTAPSKAP